MTIQHNLPAIRALDDNSKNIAGAKKSSEKLSSGYRINRSADDAAGLAVSEKMRSRIKGLNQAVRNCQDGASLIQTFEGALSSTTSILQRMRELAVESANGSYDNSTDRAAVQLEYLQLCDEVDQISETDFNGLVLLSKKNNAAESAASLPNAVKSSYASAGASTFSEVTSSERAAFSARAGGVACGDFNVVGGTLNTDFRLNGNTLEILTDTAITISGTSTTNNIVVKKDVNANITFDNLNIQFNDGIWHNSSDSSGKGTCAFLIEDDSKGNVNITLSGSNTLKSGALYAGLQKEGNGAGIGTLTINGAGSLNAVGGAHAAGIGGGVRADDTRDPTGNTKNIVINGGTINATGGAYGTVNTVNDGCGAGIGGGCKGSAENIKITGGNITAISKGSSAGIGGSLNARDIEISGGNVTAISGNIGAGIGAGIDGSSQNIRISGGTVVAIGGGFSPDNYLDGYNLAGIDTAGAGIGSGGKFLFEGGSSGGISISGKDTVVVAKGGSLKDGAKMDDVGAGYGGTDNGYDLSDKLAASAFTGTMNGINITDGTIIKFDPNAPDNSHEGDTPDTPVNPDEPDTPDIPEKPDTPGNTPTIRPAFGVDNSKITYLNGLVLQTSSRAKDAVLFTFEYESGGMGELKNDLDCSAKGLGLYSLSLSRQDSANRAIDKLDNAICKVSMIRATFGAAQNRLEHKISDLVNTNENLTEAESNIRDTDMAVEMMNFTKNNILSQSSQAILAQVNTLPNGVLSLLGA